jgi:hypothetical protein
LFVRLCPGKSAYVVVGHAVETSCQCL